MKKLSLVIISSIFFVGLLVAGLNQKESNTITSIEQDVREIALNNWNKKINKE